MHRMAGACIHPQARASEDYTSHQLYLEWIHDNFSETVCKMKRAKHNVYSLLSDLKSCSRKRDLLEGRRVHTNAVETGNNSNMFVAAALINMYAKCGSMVDARWVFDGIQKPDVVSWNALILGYADNGEGQVALDFFFMMKNASGCAPNSVTHLAAIKACTSLSLRGDSSKKALCLKRCRDIHLEIGYHLSHPVQNTLVDMYSKCGSMVDAQQVFDQIHKPDVVSWNALIKGYADNGEGHAALDVFSRMKTVGGCAPDSVTYVAAIKACTSLVADGDEVKEECLKRGREMHSEIGHHMDNFVQGTLINMYAKFGSMVDARRVFDSIKFPNVVSWTALIMGYAENGEGEAALDIFSRMKSLRVCAPNSVTYLAAIKSCMSLAVRGDCSKKKEFLKRGREIHSEIGRKLDIVLQSALIDMYAKCRSILDARQVFDSIKKPDVVSWTALLQGYADNGQGETALDLFSRMQDASGCAPDSLTYIAALKACGSIGALAIGRKFHSEITIFSVHIVTCLVDFYAKCGSMVEAFEVFNLHSTARVVPTWNSLLAGYGSFGDIDFVFKLLGAMQDQGFQPDAVTFLCMLSCCSHAGLVGKAREYLQAMPEYGISPTAMHYSCMVDVLGRANQLEEAADLLRKMPCNPDAVTWMALLGACRKWKNVEIGKLAFQSLVDLNEKNVAAHVLMAQIYGSRSMWEEQERVLVARRTLGAWKQPGQTYVVDRLGKMVQFLVGEEDLPEVKDKLEQYMKEKVYVTELSDKEKDNEKQEALCGHSEKRAVVYGILNTPPGEPVRAFKDMRMCEECHWATKIFSKLSRRIIVVRDDSWFHVVDNGNCSCGDYW